MKTNFHMLRSFEYHPEHFGLCNVKEVENIVEHFQLKERSNLDLQNLRDFVVLYYAFVTHTSELDEDTKRVLELQDTMSAITGVIDEEKFRRGMEV